MKLSVDGSHVVCVAEMLVLFVFVVVYTVVIGCVVTVTVGRISIHVQMSAMVLLSCARQDDHNELSERIFSWSNAVVVGLVPAPSRFSYIVTTDVTVGSVTVVVIGASGNFDEQ